MRTPGTQSLDLLSPTGRRVGGEPTADAADRPAVPRDPVLRQSADDGVPGAFGRDGQSQADPAAYDVDGPGGAAPETADHHRVAGRTGLSLPAPRPGVDAYQRGLEFGHYLCSNEAWFHVPDCGDRLVQPIRAVLAAVEHDGGTVLPGGVGGGAGPGPSGDLQHRPGLAVHVAGIHRPPGGGRDRGEPGRSGACAGQRVRGAIMEERKIRRYLY